MPAVQVNDRDHFTRCYGCSARLQFPCWRFQVAQTAKQGDYGRLAFFEASAWLANFRSAELGRPYSLVTAPQIMMC